MAARLLALLAAVAMVAGALVVRGRLDKDEEAAATTLRLVCATELEPVCDAVAEKDGRVRVDVEAAADTAERLTDLGPGQAADFDGWLVTAPWPAIVDEARQRQAQAAVLHAGRVLARSPVVLAVRSDRKAALDTACGGMVGWRCLGEKAGAKWSDVGGEDGWGSVKPGHAPVSGAAGLTVVGAATRAWFGGRADLSSADLDEAAFRSWLTRLERSIPRSDASPFATMLARPSAFDAVGALEQEAVPLLASAREPKPVLLYPEPVATADVVLATRPGRPGRLLAGVVSGPVGRTALVSGGWRVGGAPPGGAAAVPVTPADNLPEPGLLDALRARVGQVGR